MVHQLAMFITPVAFNAEQQALFVEADPHPRPAPAPEAPAEPKASDEPTREQYRLALELWNAILDMDEMEDGRVAQGKWARTSDLQAHKSYLIDSFGALPRAAQDAAINGEEPPEPEPTPEAPEAGDQEPIRFSRVPFLADPMLADIEAATIADGPRYTTCKVGRTGKAVHALRVREDGSTVWPACGQPRKGASAIHSIGCAGPVTCVACIAQTGGTDDQASAADDSTTEPAPAPEAPAEPEAAPEPKTAEPKMVKVVLRDREWSAKGNGSEDHRRVRLPDGRSGWASDLATDITGSWSKRPSGIMHAADRKCQQRGMLPEGTVVVSFERRFSKGSPVGPADIDAGIVDASEERGVKWGLPVRRNGDDAEVGLDGEWVTV